MKRKPNGFVATCQCGKVIGAMDYNRTDRADSGKILGQWLADGCTIEPRFTGTWSADISSCTCGIGGEVVKLNVRQGSSTLINKPVSKDFISAAISIHTDRQDEDSLRLLFEAIDRYAMQQLAACPEELSKEWGVPTHERIAEAAEHNYRLVANYGNQLHLSELPMLEKQEAFCKGAKWSISIMLNEFFPTHQKMLEKENKHLRESKVTEQECLELMVDFARNHNAAKSIGHRTDICNDAGEHFTDHFREKKTSE